MAQCLQRRSDRERNAGDPHKRDLLVDRGRGAADNDRDEHEIESIESGVLQSEQEQSHNRRSVIDRIGQIAGPLIRYWRPLGHVAVYAPPCAIGNFQRRVECPAKLASP